MNKLFLQVIVLTGLFLPVASANVYAGCETETDVKRDPKCCIDCHRKELKDLDNCAQLSGEKEKKCEINVKNNLKNCQSTCK